MAILFEMGALHAALVHAHPRPAWTLTLSSLWGVLWFLGDYQALRLRRSVLEDGVLRLRVGLRASADVPLEDIACVRCGRLGELPRNRGLLRAYPRRAEPTVLIELAHPVRAHGVYGWPVLATSIALAPDEAKHFAAQLEAARAAAARGAET